MEDRQYISLFIKFVYTISLCLNINQTVYELQGHCNFFARSALVASQREINMKDIIGHCTFFLKNNQKFKQSLRKSLTC